MLTTVNWEVGAPVKMPVQAAAEALSHCKSSFIQETECRGAAHLTQKVDPWMMHPNRQDRAGPETAGQRTADFSSERLTDRA